jgi:LacI family transcriptional regulator
MAQQARIGVIFPAPYYTYGREVMEGIMAYCRQHHCWLTCQNEASMLRHLIRPMRIGGILADIWTRPMLRTLMRSGLPVVDFSGTWEVPGLPSVHVDNQAVGRLVARHLIQKGLRHFAFCGKTFPLHARQRQAAFVAEVAKAGSPCALFAEKRSATSVGGEAAYHRAMQTWLKSLPKPVGIMTWNDFTGRDVLEACVRAHILVPSEVALVGVENDELTRAQCPISLSSVQTNGYQVGWEAMVLIRRLMRGGKASDKDIVVPPGEIVSRKSSDMLAVPNPLIARAIEFIRNRSHEPIKVQDVLKEVPLSRRALEMEFQRLYGRSPYQQITQFRIERAKSLLTKTTLSMSEVAERSGFQTQVLFSVTFKRITGLTPGEYRRQFPVRRSPEEPPATVRSGRLSQIRK